MGLDGCFGQVVRRRRRALDLTQESLARQVGCSVVTIRKVESDERRPSRQLAERLAACLGIDPADQPSFLLLARANPGTPPAPSAATPPAERPPNNLSSPLTRLIGREAAAKAICALLGREARLVTLVGPPGIGKSRLAIQAASDLLGRFPEGVFFVGLAAVGDAGLVLPTIAKVIGLKETAAQSLLAALIDYLRDRRVLLVLDNFEHVVEAAPLIAELLTACPELKALATSRAALHIRGERLFAVPPLALPPADEQLELADVRRSPAVELFVERAQAVNPDFELVAANTDAVRAICARLDGLPLAIELVAARVRLLTPHDLLARLNHRLALLTDGPRDLPARQQTLRSTIDWSHNLLDPGEQILFARLAVFIGGCSLSAAEEVGQIDGDLPLAVLDGLAALADKNLLFKEERAQGERFFAFFETIREYALERLIERGEEQIIRARYAAFYLGLAERARTQLAGEQQEAWLDRLEAEHTNLRAALEWYIQREQATEAFRLGAALWKFWHIRSHQIEARRSLGLIFELSGPHRPADRAQALYGAGWIAIDQSDYPQAKLYFDQSLALFRELGDRRGIAEALHGVGIMHEAQKNTTEAIRLFNESLALYRELGENEGIAWSLDHLGSGELSLHAYEKAQALFAESLAIFQQLRHSWGSAIALYHQGLAALARRDHAGAFELFQSGLGLFQELSSSWGVGVSLDHLGYTSLAMGEHRQAEAFFRRSLLTYQAEKNRKGISRALLGLGCVAVAAAGWERAARLFGAATMLTGASTGRVDPVGAMYEDALATLRARVDGPALDTLWVEGAAMSLSQMVAFGLGSDG